MSLMLRLSNSDLQKQETKSHTSVCIWKEALGWDLTCQWILGMKYIVQGRWNILSVIFLPFPFAPKFLSFFPVENFLLLLKTHPVPGLTVLQSWSTLASCRCTNQHIIPDYSCLPPFAFGLPSGQQQQVPEGTDEQEGPLAMLWEYRVPSPRPSPSQRASMFKFDPAWLDPTFWEGDIRTGIFDCNPRHMGPPYRGAEETIERQNLNNDTGWWCRLPGKVIPTRRNGNSQSPEMAPNTKRPEKQKELWGKDGWVQGAS